MKVYPFAFCPTQRRSQPLLTAQCFFAFRKLFTLTLTLTLVMFCSSFSDGSVDRGLLGAFISLIHV